MDIIAIVCIIRALGKRKEVQSNKDSKEADNVQRQVAKMLISTITIFFLLHLPVSNYTG